MKFKYCRIQGKELAANTRTGKGIFSMLNQLVTEQGPLMGSNQRMYILHVRQKV